jgi:glycosyltransferase involved in cell wall biosynthesis
MKIDLSIVAPALTDEPSSLQHAAQVLCKSARQTVGEAFELIFSDDGTSSSARLELEAWAKHKPHVRIVGDGTHHGLGAAVLQGIRHSRGEYVLYTDADGQVSCQELAQVWPQRRNYDLIMGFRVNRQEGWIRHLGTHLLSLLCRPMFGRRIRDVDCAFKLARRDFMKSLGCTSPGVSIDAEMILRALRKGAKLYETPVQHNPPLGHHKSRVTLRRILRGFFYLMALYPHLGHENSKN